MYIASCGSRFDCPLIPGRHACRPEENGLARKSNQNNVCLQMMYIVTWRMNGRSQVKGLHKAIFFTLHNLILITKSLDFCSTNSDCESFPSKPVCKQAMPHCSKTCQSTRSCRRDCLPVQYWDYKRRCKGKKTKKGNVFFKITQK